MASHYGVCDNEKVKDWIEPRTDIMRRCIHAIGELAYIETSFSGLIACRVIEVSWVGLVRLATVEVTARNLRAYRRGERDTVPVSRVVPRRHVYVKNAFFHIGGNPWHWGDKPDGV